MEGNAKDSDRPIWDDSTNERYAGPRGRELQYYDLEIDRLARLIKELRNTPVDAPDFAERYAKSDRLEREASHLYFQRRKVEQYEEEWRRTAKRRRVKVSAYENKKGEQSFQIHLPIDVARAFIAGEPNDLDAALKDAVREWDRKHPEAVTKPTPQERREAYTRPTRRRKPYSRVAQQDADAAKAVEAIERRVQPPEPGPSVVDDLEPIPGVPGPSPSLATRVNRLADLIEERWFGEDRSRSMHRVNRR